MHGILFRRYRSVVGSENKKHVLFLSYHLPLPDEPGAFRPWMEARLMSRAGYAVTVITSGVQYMTGKDIRPYKRWCTEEIHEGIRILRTWAPSDHRRSLLRRTLNYTSYTITAGLASLIKVSRVERVFAGTDPVFIMPVVYLVSLIKRAGLVLDERDLFPETAVALGVLRQGVLSSLIFKMQQFFRKRAIAIIAATPGIRRRLIEYGHPPSKIHLLYNADVFLTNGSTNKEDPHSLKRQTGKNFLVGYAGGLGRANDISVLLRAAGRLRDIKELGIVIIGSGERRVEYGQFCESHGLDNVFLLDAVSRDKVRSLIRQFDIGVQPLPDNKHFSNTLTSKTFDYHGTRIPTVFCGQGDTAALLSESQGGIAVEPENDSKLAEAVRILYKDDDQRRQMAESARNWYENNISIEAGAAMVQRSLDPR